MADNYINVSVTSRQNQKVTVSTPPTNAEVTATTDTGKFWAQTAERWATADTIVDNKDYSSKHYAEQAKISATNAGAYESAVKNTYNTFIDISDDSVIAVQNAKDEAVESVTSIATTGVASLNSKISEGISDINAKTNSGVELINSTKTNAVNEVNTSKNEGVVAVKNEAQKQIKNIQSTGFYMEDDKLYFTNSKGEKEEFKSGGGGLEIGDIGFTQMAIDETKGKRRILNGQLIIQDQYVQFTNIIKNAVALNPDLACTESDWQTAVTMSTNGVCYKFVIDDEGGTIRLPKYPNYFIAGLAGNASVVGNGIAIGMTNGNVNFGLTQVSHNGIPIMTGNTGAYGQPVGPETSSQNIGWQYNIGITTDPTKSGIEAQLSNNQTEQIKGTYFIQVATGSETEDNIINEIELNNPFSLLDYKFSEYELNNLSWLRSNGQWNSKAVYPAVYDLLLKIYNGTETKAGVSVKLHTEAYTDYDFVLNTAEETFRLPIKVKLASGKAVVGNGMTLGLTNGTQNVGLQLPTGGQSHTITSPNSYGKNIGSNYSQTYGTGNLTYGVTTDATKSGLELSDSDLYLYFYVGETVQNANLINAGRIEEKIADLIPDNSSLISGYAMPSNRIVQLTTGVSNTAYTAPANGYFRFSSLASSSGQGWAYLSSSSGLTVQPSNSPYNGVNGFIPVKKGDVVTMEYVNMANTPYIAFIYAQGSESEAL